MDNHTSKLKVTTFSSIGRATRIFGLKTKRIHHLHSDNQLRAFLLFEWSDKVIDIKESVGLIDIEEVIENKETLRLDKFMNKESGEKYILHTNFLITLKEGEKEVVKAISVKNISELKRNVVIEKMEIERRYWEAKGVDFIVITEKEINKTYVKNIEWVRETMLNDVVNDKDDLSDTLYYLLKESQDIKVKSVLKEFENRLELQSGIGLYIFRYLIARKEISVDMVDKIDVNKTTMELVEF